MIHTSPLGHIGGFRSGEGVIIIEFEGRTPRCIVDCVPRIPKGINGVGPGIGFFIPRSRDGLRGYRSSLNIAGSEDCPGSVALHGGDAYVPVFVIWTLPPREFCAKVREFLGLL